MAKPRASTQERGYGAEHQAERKRWIPAVAAGHVSCNRCNLPIEPQEPWDLGHNDDRTAWTGPEHQDCNRRAGQANAVAARTGRGKMTIRIW